MDEYILEAIKATPLETLIAEQEQLIRKHAETADEKGLSSRPALTMQETIDGYDVWIAAKKIMESQQQE